MRLAQRGLLLLFWFSTLVVSYTSILSVVFKPPWSNHVGMMRLILHQLGVILWSGLLSFRQQQYFFRCNQTFHADTAGVVVSHTMSQEYFVTFEEM